MKTITGFSLFTVQTVRFFRYKKIIATSFVLILYMYYIKLKTTAYKTAPRRDSYSPVVNDDILLFTLD